MTIRVPTKSGDFMFYRGKSKEKGKFSEKSGKCSVSYCLIKWSVGTTEFCNSTKKRQHYFDILKAFFVRHSSEYKTSDSDRKVN